MVSIFLFLHLRSQVEHQIRHIHNENYNIMYSFASIALELPGSLHKKAKADAQCSTALALHLLGWSWLVDENCVGEMQSKSESHSLLLPSQFKL